LHLLVSATGTIGSGGLLGEQKRWERGSCRGATSTLADGGRHYRLLLTSRLPHVASLHVPLPLPHLHFHHLALAATSFELTSPGHVVNMVLSEISPNIRTNGSHRSKLQAEVVPSPKTSVSMAPRRVQSMLRTTTETGDTGQFSVRPSRHPRSRLAMARPRSGSFESSFTGLRHPSMATQQMSWQRPRKMRSFTDLLRPDTVRSNLTSYHQNPRSRMGGPRPYPPGVDVPGSPPLGSRSLYSHRSLMTLRNQRDYRSMHSNSPGGLGAQMRKPGQRAPSLAFSDMPGYGPQFRPPYSRAGSVASSQSSAYPMSRRNFGYVPDMNNSFTSFARLPSPSVPFSHAGNARSRLSSRNTTPASFREPRRASNVSLASSMRGIPKSPTGSTAPAYYDYSESFIDEYYFSPDGDQSTSLPFGIDQTIHEHGPPPNHPRAHHARRHTPVGIRPGSIYNPAELPTGHNCTSSETSKPTSPLVSPAVVPRKTSSLVPVAIMAKQDHVLDNICSAAIMVSLIEPADPTLGGYADHCNRKLSNLTGVRMVGRP
jgi:hypothetical protein